MTNCGEGNGNPLQYSCLENPADRGAWWATVHGVTKSQTRLSDFTFTFHFHTLEKEMATHSSVLAWRIPGMREPGGLLSMGSHRVGHDWSDLAAVAWPIVPQYRNSHSQVKHGFHWLSIQCAITGPTLLTAVKSLWTSCPTSLLQLKKWLLLVFSSHI